MLPRSSRSLELICRNGPRQRRRRGCNCLVLALAMVLVLGIALWWWLFSPVPVSRSHVVGIIAGHWQNDSGATCDDGLREVDITLPVAQGVVAELERQGYQAEVLGEYSDRLNGFRGLVLVSLHADSCIPGLSGFKIAGRSNGSSAGASARLVDCLTRNYAAATGMVFHADTITSDMVHYHAFNRVAPGTPAAIVELGFMGGDRSLLTARQAWLAQGIAQGILEFLSTEALGPVTPASPR